MKIKGLFLLLIFLIFSVSIVFAQENETDQDKINQGYQCLNNKITDCNTLSTEEKIFSVLAVGECKNELISDSRNSECWPETNCQIKQTAQAILALDSSGSDASAAKSWLISQNSSPSDVIWYLEIESTEATSCTITYSGASYDVSIGEDKKISSNAGNCLLLDQNDYWLRIAPSCLNVEFQTSCDQSFLTTLLFKRQESSTVHVSNEVHSASPGGTPTNEKVNSFCFAQGGSCNYEGSLWAAVALDALDYDVESYLPYLVTFADDNQQYLPEAFLYILTGSSDYRSSLLLKQESRKWWDESGDKYYDTALALYPFQYEEPTEKSNSKQWLFETQDADGCWQGNLRNTAFILYSLFPKITIDDEDDCEDSGYYCRSSLDCLNDGGQIFDDYSCAGTYRCCNAQQVILTCAEQGGIICSSDQNCVDGTTPDAPNLRSGELCCVSGSCQEITGQASLCDASRDGVCRPGSCENDEEQSYTDECPISGDACCYPKTVSRTTSYLWIWILLIAIVLVVIGIIFRDKLSYFWFRMSGGKKPRGGPPLPPSGPMPFFPRPMQRRPMGQMRRPISKKPSEVDEVLKKLKEMGK